MKIVNTNLNFILLEIIDEKNSNGLNLKLTNTGTIPRKLEPNDFNKFELQLNGIEDKKRLKNELNKFLNKYIDVEKTKDNYLDFWSEQNQIGEFKVENYIENITELNREDWIMNYQNLLNSFYKQYDKNTKETHLQSKFLERLKKINEDEIKKYERKIEFFKNDKEKIESLKNRMNLLYRIEKMSEKFISELNNIE
ncbi:hypothetical protein [Wenyingzhuangia gilva]|nr:hypothetical protein [Wenyingzhuangia sp. chi5]